MVPVVTLVFGRNTSQLSERALDKMHRPTKTKVIVRREKDMRPYQTLSDVTIILLQEYTEIQHHFEQSEDHDLLILDNSLDTLNV